jgi:hypothetical protein
LAQPSGGQRQRGQQRQERRAQPQQQPEETLVGAHVVRANACVESGAQPVENLPVRGGGGEDRDVVQPWQDDELASRALPGVAAGQVGAERAIGRLAAPFGDAHSGDLDDACRVGVACEHEQVARISHCRRFIQHRRDKHGRRKIAEFGMMQRVEADRRCTHRVADQDKFCILSRHVLQGVVHHRADGIGELALHAGERGVGIENLGRGAVAGEVEAVRGDAVLRQLDAEGGHHFLAARIAMRDDCDDVQMLVAWREA